MTSDSSLLGEDATNAAGWTPEPLPGAAPVAPGEATAEARFGREARRQGGWLAAAKGALRSFRHRNFRLFFSGQVISLIGTWMQSLGQSWLVYELSGHSAEWLGWVAFVGQVPMFLLGFLTGALVDRVGDKRALIIATQAASMGLALVLAVLALSGTVEIWHVLLLAGVLGCVNAVDVPARQSFLVEMVGREDLPNAIALNSGMFNGARLMGPAVGGLVVAAVGPGWCFALNGASYIAVIAGLLAMTGTARRLPQGRRRASPLDGVRYAWSNPTIRAVLVVLFSIGFAGMPYTALMPIFARDILGGGAAALGLLMSAAGAGALLGAIRLAVVAGRGRISRTPPRAGIAFGLLLVAFAWSTQFWLSLAMLFLSGFFALTAVGSTNTTVQQSVPDALRGRVMALYAMLFMGVSPFGALASGLIAHRLGAPAAVTIGGAICILTGLGVMLAEPRYSSSS